MESVSITSTASRDGRVLDLPSVFRFNPIQIESAFEPCQVPMPGRMIGSHQRKDTDQRPLPARAPAGDSGRSRRLHSSNHHGHRVAVDAAQRPRIDSPREGPFHPAWDE